MFRRNTYPPKSTLLIVLHSHLYIICMRSFCTFTPADAWRLGNAAFYCFASVLPAQFFVSSWDTWCVVVTSLKRPLEQWFVPVLYSAFYIQLLNYLLSQISFKVRKIINVPKWIETCTKFPSQVTTSITILHIIADMFWVRSKLLHSHLHHCYLVPPVTLPLSLQVGIHQRTIVVHNHHFLPKRFLPNNPIPALSCFRVDFIALTFIAKHYFADI